MSYMLSSTIFDTLNDMFSGSCMTMAPAGTSLQLPSLSASFILASLFCYS